MSNEITPDNTGRKQDGTFEKGYSGNPDGKPKGVVHKATQAAREMLEGETEALTRKAIEMALEGDITALKLCLDRLVPTLKSTAPITQLDMPHPNNLADTARAFVNAAASGQLAPDVAAQLVSAVASAARVEEIEHVKHRLETLERAIKERK